MLRAQRSGGGPICSPAYFSPALRRPLATRPIPDKGSARAAPVATELNGRGRTTTNKTTITGARARGRRKPGDANRAHDILRSLFDCAIAWGHRPEAAGNPCKGIVRYRRPPRGRLLGADDLANLGTVLRQRENDDPACVAAVRLLLLTGCRPGEIRCLRWCEVTPDRLALEDSKTGPRHVLLGAAARALLDGHAGTVSGEWVFPRENGDGPLDKNDLYQFWLAARDAAGIVADARLHDLRHAHASHAVMNGESLHVAGRLLGHRRASTTNRYVHLDDATLGDAAERVAAASARKLRGPPRAPKSTLPYPKASQQDHGYPAHLRLIVRLRFTIAADCCHEDVGRVSCRKW